MVSTSSVVLGGLLSVLMIILPIIIMAIVVIIAFVISKNRRNGNPKDKIVLDKSAMNKKILNIIRIVCIFVLAGFFFSYFVVSCDGEDYQITGKDAAFGFDMGFDIESEPNLNVLNIPGVALFILLLMFIPLKNKELGDSKINITIEHIVPVIGSIIGLILLYKLYNTSIGEVRRKVGGGNIGEYFHTGIGFKASVAAYIIMFIMPIVDIILKFSS